MYKGLAFPWKMGLLISTKSFLLKLTVWSMLPTILKLFFNIVFQIFSESVLAPAEFR